MQGDVHGMIKDSMALGFLPMDVDLEVLEPELQYLYDQAQVPQIIQAVAEGGSAYKAVVTRRKRMLSISYELNKFFFKYPFMIPDYFALLIRSMVVLEGIAVTGDPAFDLFRGILTGETGLWRAGSRKELRGKHKHELGLRGVSL